MDDEDTSDIKQILENLHDKTRNELFWDWFEEHFPPERFVNWTLIIYFVGMFVYLYFRY